MATRSDSDRISAEAIDWFVKFQDSARTRPPPQAFAEWLTRSPRHVEEYLHVCCAWDLLEIPNEGDLESAALIAAAAKERPEADNIVRLQDRYGGRYWPVHNQPRRRIPRTAWATAACAVLAVGAWLGYAHWHSANEFATLVGEQHSVTLQDGSVVFLNTDSKVDVRWLAAERHIDLIRGEARFQVTRNPTRPFIVATSKAQVKAVGTVFNVRADTRSTQVAVMEGAVEVTSMKATEPSPGSDRESVAPGASPPPAARHSASIRLAAGERAAITNSGIEANVGPSIESVVAWTQRRLVFRSEPLRTIVNEFNRYRTQPLVLDDPQLETLEISGAFDLNDPESLVAYLRTFETVQIERPSDGSEHLSRTPEAAISSLD